MIKAIFFDLDNTIIDFMTMKLKSCEAAIDAMLAAGLSMQREEALKTLFTIYDETNIEEQHIFEKFLKRTQGKVNYKIVAHGILAYRNARASYMHPYPKAVRTLLELKKHYTLVIISDAPRLQAWMRLVSLGIDDFFDLVITAADVRKQKTHTTPFKAALKTLNLRPEEALMVGDRIARDVQTAKKLGIKTCYARYGDNTFLRKPAERGASGADFELDTIDDLLKLPLGN